VLDSSASIKPFVDNIKEGAKSFVSAMKPTDRALVVKFSNQISFLQKLTADQDSLKVAVDNLYPTGGTKLYDGLHRGLTELEGRNRYLLLFTDGRDERVTGDGQPYSSHSLKEVVQLAMSKKIRIFTIAVGRDVDTRILQGLAKKTGGRFFHAMDPQKVLQIYQTLSQLLNFRYRINYQTPNLAQDGKWRFIRLTHVQGKETAEQKYRVTAEMKFASDSGSSDMQKNTRGKSDGEYSGEGSLHGKVKVGTPSLGKNPLDAPKIDNTPDVKAPKKEYDPELTAPTVPVGIAGMKETQEGLDKTFADINQSNRDFTDQHNSQMDSTMDYVNDSKREQNQNINDSLEEQYDSLNDNDSNMVDSYNNNMEDYTDTLNDALNF
jgi:hypothetical protein